MKILRDLFGIALATAVFATAIFHPLCIVALAGVTIAYHLGEVKNRLATLIILWIRKEGK